MALSQPITVFLDHALSDAAQRLIKLEQTIKAYLPHTLSDMVHVGGIYGQGADIELILLVAHGAAAARIRQSLPSLLTYLQSSGWGLSSLRIKIQPDHHMIHNAKKIAVSKHAVLSQIGIQSLQQLCMQLAPSSLREAIKSLLSKHGG